MVFVRNRRAGGNRYRVGQNGNGVQRMNGNGTLTEDITATNGNGTTTDPRGSVVRNIQSFDGNQVNEATTTIDGLEAHTARIDNPLDYDVAIDPETSAVTTVITQQDTGAQAVVTMPAAPVAAEPDDECTFPTQSIALSRDVQITNTPPMIEEVYTDRCGNATGFRQTMTRTISSGPWVANSGLSGDFGTFEVNGQQRIVYSDNPNLRIANSLGQPAGNGNTRVSQVTNDRVGRRRAGGNRYGNGSAQSFGQSLLTRGFRSA